MAFKKLVMLKFRKIKLVMLKFREVMLKFRKFFLEETGKNSILI